MLPSRPSPRAVGGLPPSRSRSLMTDRDHVTSRRYGTAELSSDSGAAFPRSRQNTTARERSRSRPRATTPETRQLNRTASSQRTYDRTDASRFNIPDPSPSPTGSLLDRMRAGRVQTSSRTSVEEEGGRYGSRRLQERDITEKSNRAAGRNTTEADGKFAQVVEDGYSLWDKVATAASTLTVSVSKAWQTKVTTHEGEKTPPGAESRLTRAMKAYHLEKARDPTDLPEWLFSEQERRPVVRSRFASPREERNSRYDEEDDRSSQPPVATGLRNIYAAAAAAAGGPGTVSPTGRAREEGSGTSKATDRLKALRDAKRNAVNPNRQFDERPAVVESRDVDGPSRRMGLPSRPSRF